MKINLSLCLFVIMAIANSHKVKGDSYKPETPEEAALYAIANKNISPNDITEDNLWKYKEEELCWIGEIIGYSPNTDKESVLLKFSYYVYNWRKTGNQNKFVMHQAREESEFMAIYIPENINTFIDGFRGGTIRFVVIYGKVAEFRSYTRIADGSYHSCVSIEDVDYMRILDSNLVEIVPFVVGANDIFQENDAVQEEENGAEPELSENNEAENLPQDKESSIDKQRLPIILVISLLALAGVGMVMVRRYRKVAKIKQ